MSTDHLAPEQRFVGERNGVRPEVVMWRRAQVAKALGYFCGRCGHAGVSGIAEYADTSVEGDGTSGPTACFIQSEPAMGVFMIHMHGIEEGNENVDV